MSDAQFTLYSTLIGPNGKPLKQTRSYLEMATIVAYLWLFLGPLLTS